ncbi:hypothetical protein ACQRIU_001254 [Beauveria bassiana]
MAEPVTTNIEPKTPAGDDTPHDALLLPRLALLDAGKTPLTSWTPSSDEEQRIFRVWKGFTLAERTKDTVSWIWDYGVEIQSQASRRWICMPCVRQKASSPQSYESRGTQNAEHHLWKSHGYWDPSGRRRTPLQTQEGRKAFASITDLIGLKRSEPNDQALANNLIRRFDQAEFQKLVVNWIVESQQSFRQVEHPRLRQIFEYLNPAFLLGKLEDAKSRIETHPEPEQFGININLGWMKLDKYYNTLRDSPVYYAAAALHPGLRWTYFDEIWGQHHPEWVKEAKQLVQQLWSNEYRNLQITIASTADGPALKKQKTVLSSFDR